MEGSQFYFARILWSHLKQNLLEGMERTAFSIDIVLVNLEIDRNEQPSAYAKYNILVYQDGQTSD